MTKKNSLGLPENYSVPETQSNYMKFQKGDNKFRVLSTAIVGWEYWNKDNKPVRTREYPEKYPTEDARIDTDGRASECKHFIAMVVWNYTAEKVQILEITQKKIQRALSSYAMDEDMGDIQDYDIKVTKTGEGLKTEYEVRPLQAKPLDPKIKQTYEEMDTIRLEELYRGGDPFNPVQEGLHEFVEDEEDEADKIPF